MNKIEIEQITNLIIFVTEILIMLITDLGILVTMSTFLGIMITKAVVITMISLLGALRKSVTLVVNQVI